MKKILISFMVLGSINLVAHEQEQNNPEADMVGVGKLKSKPDLLSLSFEVRSECYENPKNAQESTDKVVKELDDFLGKFRRREDPHFKVLVDGGFTTSYSRWENNREVCKNTFQKSTTVTLKIGIEDQIDEVFSRIQSAALKQFSPNVPSSDWQRPRTYVTISTPFPELSDENRKTLERQALGLAMADAKANFLAAMQSCPDMQWKVHKVREEGGGYGPPRPRHYAAAKLMVADAAESSAPVRFDDLTVEKRLQVTFRFDLGSCR